MYHGLPLLVVASALLVAWAAAQDDYDTEVVEVDPAEVGLVHVLSNRGAVSHQVYGLLKYSFLPMTTFLCNLTIRASLVPRPS